MIFVDTYIGTMSYGLESFYKFVTHTESVTLMLRVEAGSLKYYCIFLTDFTHYSGPDNHS